MENRLGRLVPLRRALLGSLLVLPAGAFADQVFLKGGGKVTGVVVQQTAEAVVVEVGAGRVTLPAQRVERIVAGTSALSSFRERALSLAQDDVGGWLELALWASGQGLHTQARDAFERVLVLDPRNSAAQQALGNVRLADRWVTPEESYRARGYVYFEGRWVTPEERDDALRLEAARAQGALAESARAEADARAREAEARARAAEADARRAESDALGSSGVPLWFLAGGGCCGRTHFPPRGPRHEAHATPAPLPPTPAPPRPTRPARTVTARAGQH
jgi:hypothetical protein